MEESSPFNQDKLVARQENIVAVWIFICVVALLATIYIIVSEVPETRFAPALAGAWLALCIKRLAERLHQLNLITSYGR